MFLLWVKFFLTIFFIVIAVWVGVILGRLYVRKVQGPIDHAPVGSAVGAALGLLAFMLAFTFQLTANRYDSRRELFREEVLAIKTTYLRAELLKDANSIPIRKLILKYISQHFEVAVGMSREKLRKAVGNAKKTQDSIWNHAIALAREDRGSETYALFTESVNDMIDYYDKRIVVATISGIPQVVLWILYAIAFFSMVILGFQFGLVGKSHVYVILTLALIFSAVMWLIFALDDPLLGIVKISQKRLLDLQNELSARPM